MAKQLFAETLRIHRPTQTTACGMTRVVHVDLVQFQLWSSRFGWTIRREFAVTQTRLGENHLCTK